MQKQDTAKCLLAGIFAGDCFYRAKPVSEEMRSICGGMDDGKDKDMDMEKDTEQNAERLQGDERIGEVRIADDVVAMIAGLAALEVEGVCALSGSAADGLLSRVGVKGMNKGVRIEVVDRIVSVEIAVTLQYGCNILKVSEKIQEKIKSTIETMTGLTVADVNIRVAGVVMGD